MQRHQIEGAKVAEWASLISNYKCEDVQE
jgi:hypothetical protein